MAAEATPRLRGRSSHRRSRAESPEIGPPPLQGIDFGPDHPDTADSLNNLAVLYDNQGRYADAEPLYR